MNRGRKGRQGKTKAGREEQSRKTGRKTRRHGVRQRGKWTEKRQEEKEPGRKDEHEKRQMNRQTDGCKKV